MRVITTCSAAGLKQYAHRWLASRENWPKGTDFQFYREGFAVDCPGKDLSELTDLVAWKKRREGFIPPDWRFDVVRFANKVFAACDAFMDYDGIGVWLDADCVTYKKLPPQGLIEGLLGDAYLACFQRTGFYTETGLWIMNCAHAEHRKFLEAWKSLYLADRFKDLPQWHDCIMLDATIRRFSNLIKVRNLSGEAHKAMHPMALTELGRYIDHCKGRRKESGRSPENKFREAA